MITGIGKPGLLQGIWSHSLNELGVMDAYMLTTSYDEIAD